MVNKINIPVYRPELEIAVLGAILCDKEAFFEITHIVNENSFKDERHQKVYKAISTLVRSGMPIDILTVTQQLRKDENLEFVGGAYFVTSLTSNISSSSNIAAHAAIIQQDFYAREMFKMACTLRDECLEGSNDIFDVIDNFVNEALSLTDLSSGDANNLSDLIGSQLKDYKNHSDGNLTGVTSGFNSIDELTNGFQKSNLIIIAGRPAMGKTAFMLNLARNAAVYGNESVAIFSLEMGKEQLTDRFIAAEADVSLNNITKRKLTNEDNSSMGNLNNLIKSNIFIDDTAALSIQSFRSKASKLKRRNNIGLIIVDYLQLMRGEGDKWSREQEISSISRGLKGVAKTLDIPIIALSQLSRKVDERTDKRPLLSDLRESGSIEQDADQVIFLFRPEYYGIRKDTNGNDLTGMSEIIFAKNRQGCTDSLLLSFDGSKMKFSDIDTNIF